MSTLVNLQNTLRQRLAKWNLFQSSQKVAHTQNCEVRSPRDHYNWNFHLILDFLASDIMRVSLRPPFVHTSHTEFFDRTCDTWTRRVWLAETGKPASCGADANSSCFNANCMCVSGHDSPYILIIIYSTTLWGFSMTSFTCQNVYIFILAEK